MQIILILVLFFCSFLYAQENTKIQIEIQELKEEVLNYRTFKIIAYNPNQEKRTIIGKIEFENGDFCNFYIELNEIENKEQIRHCKVKKYRSSYRIIIEKVFPFIVQE